MYIEIPADFVGDLGQVLGEIACEPGASWVAEMAWFPAAEIALFSQEPDIAAIESLAVILAQDNYREGASFAIRVKRADKRFAMRTRELERLLGAAVLSETDWSSVRLRDPDLPIYVDVTSRGLYLYCEKIAGVGGLPIGTSGRALTLLSGGFDSPVAAFQIAKRGCQVDFIHFTANLMQQKRAQEYKISRIVQQLSRYLGPVRLYLLPYTHFDLALMDQNVPYDLILFRRFMARLAESIAERIEAQVLITGDNLGQVASQTMENMNSMTQAINMPILRPLIAYEKEEIVARSRQLGLYDLSCEPYKDCCALISHSPKTRSRHEKLCSLEARCFPNYQEIVDQTVEEMMTLDFAHGRCLT